MNQKITGEKEITTTDQFGKEIKGIKVEITKEHEGWCNYELKDGTHLKIKPIIVSVVRTNNFTPDGEPIYLVKTHEVIITDAPSNLRKANTNAKQ